MKKLDVYKCEECGNIVEVLHWGGGDLVCCGKNMKLMEEKSADSTTEKHVPVVEAIQGGYKVTVGSTLHPMKEEHFIEWIELITETDTLITFLKPGDEPVAIFKTDEKAVMAREYCNLHGLWKNEM
ncbi:MAG: desulfoferrodoxin [Clostridia bacterium]|nr:desulfoferrodoxin [Clostridia bacterium]